MRILAALCSHEHFIRSKVRNHQSVLVWPGGTVLFKNGSPTWDSNRSWLTDINHISTQSVSRPWWSDRHYLCLKQTYVWCLLNATQMPDAIQKATLPFLFPIPAASWQFKDNPSFISQRQNDKGHETINANYVSIISHVDVSQNVEMTKHLITIIN